MSALTDRVTAEHPQPQAFMGYAYCPCGQVWTSAHIAQVTEDAVREMLADGIAALEYTRQQSRERVIEGFGLEWVDGYNGAVFDAVELVHSEVTPQ